MLGNRAALALCAALAIVSCGKHSDAPRSASSMEASDIDAGSPIDRPYRIKNAEALDVDKFFKILPLYLRPTYDKPEFDEKSGATIIRNLKFSGDDEIAIARAEFYGVDMEAIDRIGAEDITGLDAPMETVLRKLRLFDIKSDADEADAPAMMIGAIEIDTLRIRQGGLPEESPASGLAALFNAFEVAGVYFKDVNGGAAEGVKSKSDISVKFAAADMRFVGVNGGRLDAFVARDFDYQVDQSQSAIAAAGKGLGPAGDILVNGPLRNFIAPANQRVKIGSIEWKDISFAGLMEYGLKGEKPPISARNLINLGAAHFADVETYYGEKRVSLAPETDISAMEFAWLLPSKIRAVSRGVLYDFTGYVPDEEEEAIAALKSRGLDRIKADSNLAYDWSAEKGDAVFSTYYDSNGFADLKIDAALEGLELKRIDAASAAGARNPAADLAKLKRFSFVVDDDQMLDAFFALSALQTGGEAKDVRAATPALMRLTQLELKRSNPRIASYVDAIADFLEDGGALEIKAEPETPVPLSAINAALAGGPDAMAAAINLTVTQKD